MIGLINFSHTEPLSMAIDHRSYVREHPRDLLNHVLDGTVDCAMVSLVSYLENRESLSMMETANIHSQRGTLSTLLISRGECIARDMDIAITAHTRTTSYYLDLILSAMHIPHRDHFTNSTEASDLLSDSSYALVIGDEALKVFNGGYRVLMDIGYEFSRIFSMPPVYAVTVCRKDHEYPAGDFSILQDGVHASTKFKGEAAERISRSLHVSRSIVASYYNCISYDFNPMVGNTVDFVQRGILQ